MAYQRLIIGDIHGCWDELQALLDKAGLGEEAEIIALGDIVDRGPSSDRVFEFFSTHPQARSLKGNHESKHLKASEGKTKPALSQLITRYQLGEECYPKALAYFATLPHYLELPEAILVHGMVEPGKPLEDQKPEILMGSLSGQRYMFTQYSRPWYELYQGEKPLIVGHMDYSGKAQPFNWQDRVFGIDTDCCRGGALTGILLPEFRIISVPSRGDHWSYVARAHKDLISEACRIKELSWDRAKDLLEQWTSSSSEEEVPHPLLDEVRDLVEQGEYMLQVLYRYLTATCDNIIQQLRAEADFDHLSEREQGQLFAKRIGQTPLASLLHLARKGKLSRDVLRENFPRPTQVIRIVRDLQDRGHLPKDLLDLRPED